MMAMESGYPDYIDLEVELDGKGRQAFLDCHAMILQLGGKCIASYHDFQKTPAGENVERFSALWPPMERTR